MEKVTRREFMGNRALFIILCLTGFGIPVAVLYLIESTVDIEIEVEDAEEFLEFAKKNK